MGERPQLFLHLIENCADFLNSTLERGIDIVSHIGHRQASCKKELTSLIMDGVGNALYFLFQRFIQSA